MVHENRAPSESVGDRQSSDTIYENKQPAPSFHDGVKAQLVIDAALTSHRKGRWMALSGA